MNKKKFKKKWFPYIWNGYHKDVETDLDELINSVKDECVKIVDGMKIKNYDKENQATRTMFDNINHILNNAISAIRDSKERCK